YYSYLLKKEIDYDYADNQANNYLIKPIKEWTWWTCVRFFHEYKDHFNAGWGEVPNNREALLAFWFGGRDITVKDVNNTPVKLNLYMDIIYGNNKIKVSYRISLNKNEQKDSIIRDKIYDAFVPFLKKDGIECRKAKFTKAKQTILLAHISNLDTNMKYGAFVKQIEVYQQALNEFVESRT
ncbi:MAG: hypothetical protein QG594_1632, partial [Bacteroidota bacterium]|nr:hypothetical protein [Bacteroidota bacterium]